MCLKSQELMHPRRERERESKDNKYLKYTAITFSYQVIFNMVNIFSKSVCYTFCYRADDIIRNVFFKDNCLTFHLSLKYSRPFLYQYHDQSIKEFH